ncbi:MULTISPECIES: hypothetical protein [unclassified Sphingomonas]|uniref:hypothetical protein n=1 Tax=unclassified Sphingomonas TaxID=196159 RepID=UPI00257D8724|nr:MULTISPECIES: hypothetical protein [unclassified Sphingomonas]
MMRPAEAEAQPDPSDIREALRLIHESGVLGEGKLSLLLDYLVEEELAGRGDRLKGYSIALDVFKRGEDFDPSIDSVVRVEMLRLRKALAQYHAQPDPAARVVINLAKGSYRPTFSKRAEAAAPERADRKAALGAFFAARRLALAGLALVLLAALSIVVFKPFQAAKDYHCLRPSLALRSNGFMPVRETQFQGVFSKILQAYPLVLTGAAPKSCPAMQRRLELTQVSERSLQAALYRAAETNPYWAQTFTIDRGDVELVMAKILYRVASHEGALVKDMLRGKWENQQAKQDYACHVNGYSHFINPMTDNPADDVACLRASMKEKSPFADTYSTYAIFVQLRYYDQTLYGKADREKLLAEYRQAMNRALAIDPTECLALVARLREYRRAVPPDHERLAETVETINRYCVGNPFMSSHVAMIEGYVFNDWAASRNLLDRAIAISGLKHWYSHSLFGNLLVAGKWAEAHDKIKWFQSILNPVDAIWLVVIGNHVGDRAMTGEGLEYLRRRSIRTYEDAENFIGRAGYHPDFAGKLLDELSDVLPHAGAANKSDVTKIPASPRG